MTCKKQFICFSCSLAFNFLIQFLLKTYFFEFLLVISCFFFTFFPFIVFFVSPNFSISGTNLFSIFNFYPIL